MLRTGNPAASGELPSDLPRPVRSSGGRWNMPNGPGRQPRVAVLFFMTIPGLAAGLAALAALDRLGLVAARPERACLVSRRPPARPGAWPR
jgi:hypothetical protein